MTEFSAEVLAAWRRCRRGANEEAVAELNRLLGLRPWQVSPIDARPGPSPWPAGCAATDSWPRAQALCRQLDEAVRQSAPKDGAKRVTKAERRDSDELSNTQLVDPAGGPRDAAEGVQTVQIPPNGQSREGS
jgi:hypothetical protein